MLTNGESTDTMAAMTSWICRLKLIENVLAMSKSSRAFDFVSLSSLESSRDVISSYEQSWLDLGFGDQSTVSGMNSTSCSCALDLLDDSEKGIFKVGLECLKGSAGEVSTILRLKIRYLASCIFEESSSGANILSPLL